MTATNGPIRNLSLSEEYALSRADGQAMPATSEQFLLQMLDPSYHVTGANFLTLFKQALALETTVEGEEPTQ